MKKDRNRNYLGGGILAILFLFLGISPLSAQNITVRGIVTDAQNEPLIGATIIVQGTSNGTVTDIDGNYVLNNVPSNGTLEASYVGMRTQTIAVNGRTRIDVRMEEDSELLEEVVITGYGGTQLRSKVTNSIAKVSEETFKVGVYANAGSALSGAVSGLRVVNTSGRPGATPNIVLRGGTNFNGSGSPLIVVDGMLRGSFSEINPEDIESMEVLKDAGATAVYGARASNGVILITTKRGKAGQGTVSFKARLGANYANMGYEFLGVEDYITYMRKAYADPLAEIIWKSRNQKAKLSSTEPFGTGNVYGTAMKWNLMKYDPKSDLHASLLQKGWKVMDDPVSKDQLIYKGVNPQDYNMQNPSYTQDYNLSFSGGNDKGHYYAGLGYNYMQGLPINTFYKRYNATFNGDYQVLNWLKSTTNFSYNRANWNGLPPTQTSEANYFGRIMSTPPTVRMEDEEGNPTLGPSAGDGNQSYQAHKFIRDHQSDKFTMIQGLEASLFPFLTLNLNGSWFISESVSEQFNKDYENQIGAFVTTRGTSASWSRDFSQTYNGTLRYRNTFGGIHYLDAMVGTEYYDLYYRGFSASGQGAPTDDFMDLGLTDKGEGKRNIDSAHSQYRILSFFGRVNYDLMEKYLLSFTVRRDGYSSLLNNRWGTFPGISAGWLFSKEDFSKDFSHWLSFGKLRASYGQNGNATGIGAYDLQGSYGTTTYNGNVGFLIGGLPNPGLRWERTNTSEVGIDLGFFNNRLNTNFTFYNRITSDKYAAYKLPSTTGFSSITNNNGIFRNRGMEFEVSAKVLRLKDFRWDINTNISYNKNKIIKLPDNGLPNNRQNGQEVYTGNGNETMFVGGYQEGQEPGLMIGYVAQGIYQSNDEVPSNYRDIVGNNAGKEIVPFSVWNSKTDAEKQNRFLPIGAGDVRWKDINGDGIIDVKDQAVIGNTTPRWFGGFSSTMNWKGLTLYVRMDYALDFWSYDQATPWFNGAGQGTYNATTDVFNSWSPENPNAKYPKYVFFDLGQNNNYFRNSTLFAFRGDYLAFREVQLAYSLPKQWMESLKIQDLTLSLSGQNLGYLKNGRGNTPEVSRSAGFGSGDGYGLPRTFLLGVDIKF